MDWDQLNQEWVCISYRSTLTKLNPAKRILQNWGCKGGIEVMLGSNLGTHRSIYILAKVETMCGISHDIKVAVLRLCKIGKTGEAKRGRYSGIAGGVGT